MKKSSILTRGFFSIILLLIASYGINAQNTSKVSNVTPLLQEGTSGEARTLSMKKNTLVLHVSGGTQDKYSAEQYARMFQIMFKDPGRTDFPTEISVLHSESGKDRSTGVYAFLNGYAFDKNGGGYFSGDGVFTAKEVVEWIPKITKQQAERAEITSAN